MIWYDVNKTLTHNALINIVIGPRGSGKTYALKKKAVNDFVKKGKQFAYVRRFDTELEKVKNNLFDDIIVNGDNHGLDIQQKGDTFLFNDEVAGYAIALSRAQYFKSASFPLVDLIFFDEFIIDKANSRYLKNEVQQLLDLYETIARTREGVKLFLLANSLSFVNPYTIYWSLKLPKNKNICKAVDGLVLCEIVDVPGFTEMKKQTTFGKLIQGSQYEDYIVNNQFILDSDTFIEKKTAGAKYLFTFTSYGVKYGFWRDVNLGLYYVSNDIDPYCNIVYSTTMQDHQPNMMLLKRSNKGLFQYLLDSYRDGNLRFESQQIKKAVEDIIKMTL